MNNYITEMVTPSSEFDSEVNDIFDVNFSIYVIRNN